MSEDSKPAKVGSSKGLGHPEKLRALAALRRASPLHDASSTEAEWLEAAADKLERLAWVANAARTYFLHYAQDEAEDEDDCVCGREQHIRAAELRDALAALARVA